MNSADKTTKQEEFLKTNWRDLINQAKTTKQNIIQIIEDHQLETSFLQKSYESGRVLYIQSETLGISLQLEDNILNCAYIYSPYGKRFKAFPEEYLPMKLNWKVNNTAVVALLGEPSSKSGGGVTAICLTYERHGLEFTFATKNWAEKESIIDFICYFKRNESDKRCAVCGKDTNQLCARCKIPLYCSVDCQKQHFQAHKSVCKLFDKEEISKNNEGDKK